MIRVRELIEGDGEYFLAMDLAVTDLENWVCEKRFKNEHQKRACLYQISQGVRALHVDKETTHRDLRPSNVLLTVDGTFKLADFGISRRIENKKTWYTPTVAALMQPPESLRALARNEKQPVSPAVDIYMLGLLFHFVWTDGHYPWTIDDHYYKAKTEPVPPLDKLPDIHVKYLVELMLLQEPSSRPPIEEVIGHVFFLNHSSRMALILKYYERLPQLATFARPIIDAFNANPRSKTWHNQIHSSLRAQIHLSGRDATSFEGIVTFFRHARMHIDCLPVKNQRELLESKENGRSWGTTTEYLFEHPSLSWFSSLVYREEIKIRGQIRSAASFFSITKLDSTVPRASPDGSASVFSSISKSPSFSLSRFCRGR